MASLRYVFGKRAVLDTEQGRAGFANQNISRSKKLRKVWPKPVCSDFLRMRLYVEIIYWKSGNLDLWQSFRGDVARKIW